MVNKNKIFTCIYPSLRGAVVIFLIFYLAFISSGQTGGQRQRRASGSSDETRQAGTAREALTLAKSAESPAERIKLLERFIKNNKGLEFEGEAREALMREYMLRGQQQLKEGNPSIALDEFKAAFRSAPAEISEKIFSEYIYPMPIAVNAFGFRSESVELMRAFEARFESDFNRLLQIGFFYIEVEAPLEAVRVLERTAGLAPQESRVHNSLGTAYLINLRLDDAMSEFKRALEINPRDTVANLNLANLLRASGEYSLAVGYYRKHIEINPADSDGHGGLGITLLALARDEEGQSELARATELGPDNFRFFTQLAFFQITRKKTGQAREAINQALKIQPRYIWSHITKANIDSFEGKSGDALSTMLISQNYGGFPTQTFETAKVFAALDGYDQAVDIMKRSFKINESGEFETMLGGVIRARSPQLNMLLERERHASLFINEQTTTSTQYKLIESIFKFDHYKRMALAAKSARKDPTGQVSSVRPRRSSQGDNVAELTAGSDSGLAGIEEMLNAIRVVISLDDGRQAFRMLWISKSLAESGVGLDAAEYLAKQVIQMAEAATEPAGSLRDAPLYDNDRKGRLNLFLGRAEDVLGWTLLKKKNIRGAIEHLTKSTDAYDPCDERLAALWHLAVATEEAGNLKNALDLYISAFNPTSPTANIRRSKIEDLYKKVNGSLEGLDNKLKMNN